MATSEKTIWRIRMIGTVISAYFENSSLEGNRSILTLRLSSGEYIRFRLPHLLFHHLMEKMKDKWELREEFTTADGMELHRWLKGKSIKVRISLFEMTTPFLPENKWTTVEFVELIE